MDARGYYRTPTIAGQTIVFVCEDDLWSVAVEGGIARRLTAGPAQSSMPRLAPDGMTIAYIGRDEGTPEVYTIPTEGGLPQRLTHLGSDVLYVCGWSHDGQRIYFTSDAGTAFVKETIAFSVHRDGGAVERIPIGHAMSFARAASGATLIGRNNLDPARWKRYRGGTAGALWIDAIGSGTFTRVGRELNGNLAWPLWVGERIAFLSDHGGIANIYTMDADGTDVRALTNEREYFARFPDTDGARIVYTAGADIVLADTRDGSVRRLDVHTPSGAPQLARKFVDAADFLETFGPSPDGTSVALVARGRAYAMPLWEAAVSEYGAEREARRRELVWLHDGTRLAYVDDADGFERILSVSLDQSAAPIELTNGDIGRVTQLVASPAGDRLAFANHRHELYVLDIGTEPRQLDRGGAQRCADLAFSPDGKYLAYTWSPKSETSIVRIADCDDGSVHDATAALRSDRSPAWDPEGKYLYFIAARDFNPVYDALQFDLSFPEAMRPYVVTLRTDVANPFVPIPAALHTDDDDKAQDDDKSDDEAKDAPKRPKPIEIDFDGLPQRILAFPVEEGVYHQIVGVKGRAIFSRSPVRGIKQHADEDEHEIATLVGYDFTQQRSATLANGIDDFVLGADARTLVYAAGGKLRAIDAAGEFPDDEPDEKPATETNRRSGWLDLGRIGVRVEPRTEWRQMLREAWRLQREQFWDPQMSGIDWDAVLPRYEALVSRVRTRAELSDLIWEMQGELGTSHAYEIGGDLRPSPQYRRGFLGADIHHDPARGYTIERILRGDSWNRDDDSPLAAPGVDARVGDAIIAIGGRPVSRTVTPDELLVNLAGHDIAIDLLRADAPKPHRIIVRTLRDERMVRYRAWVDANRELVHARSFNRVGYVHIPDMGPWGFAEFHRGYLSEFDRDGLIVDVRYNRGGHVSPLLLEKLARKRVGYDVSRYGTPQPYPPESVAGPIVALTNQFAGSDGDIFSHVFKIYKLGTLVGTRTWGGVVGINPYHHLVDGTVTTQPEYSFWFVDTGWGVENYGTDPDVEVDIAPQESAAGIDPQMDTALRLMDEALARAPKRPTFEPYPNRGYGFSRM